MKLLRPLHRRRSKRRARARVLSSAELIVHFQLNAPCSDYPTAQTVLETLELVLRDKNVNYHKDSQGEIWASIDATP